MADGEKQYIQLPDGSYGEFPAEMKDEEIRAAVDKAYPPTKMQGAERFVRSVPGALKEMAGEAGRRAEKWWTTPTPYESTNPALTREEATLPYAGSPQETFHRGAAIEMGMGAPALATGLVTAPLATGLGLAGGTAGGYLGEKGGRYLGGKVGAPELGGDIGATLGMVAGGRAGEVTGERISPAARELLAQRTRTAPAPETPRPRLADTVPGKAERMHELANTLEEAMTRPTATQQLDASAQKLFGKNFGELDHEHQIMATRALHEAGTPGGPPERRTLRGTAPVAEQRSMEMAKPTVGTPGGAAAFTIETDPKMGIRWAKTPGLPDISIPPRMTDPNEISRYVADKQALQRQGMATLPKTTIPAPGAPGAAPDAIQQQAEAQVEKMRGSAYPKTGAFEDFNQRNRARINEAIEQERAGTLPPVSTGPPAAPAPTTLGGGTVPKPAVPGTEPGAPRTLDEAVDQAVGLKKK